MSEKIKKFHSGKVTQTQKLFSPFHFSKALDKLGLLYCVKLVYRLSSFFSSIPLNFSDTCKRLFFNTMNGSPLHPKYVFNGEGKMYF